MYIIKVTYHTVDDHTRVFRNEKHSGPYVEHDEAMVIARKLSAEDKTKDDYYFVGEKEDIGRHGIAAS